MSFFNTKSHKKSFSLTEISVVIAVVSLLIFTSVRSLKNVFNQTQANVDAQKIKIVKQALQTYFNTHGHLPAPADYTLTNNDVNYGKSKTEKSSYDGTLDADIFAYKWDKKKIPHLEEKQQSVESATITYNLPTEYQEVEYIENNNLNDYINTQYVPQINDIIELDYQVVYIKNNYSCVGVYDNHSYHISSTICINKNNLIEYHIGGVDARLNHVSFSTPLDRHSYKWDYTNAELYCDNNLVYSANVSQLVSTTYPFYIFMSSGDYSYQHKGRFYSLKVKRNDEVIKHYIPVYRKSDNVIGIYDIVEGKFYTNSGTGTFLVGKNINNVYNSQQTIKTNSLTYTEEDCGNKKANIEYNVYRGIVPFKVLNIKEEDVVDSKGNFFEYYVPEIMTLSKGTKPSKVEGQELKSNGYIKNTKTKNDNEYLGYSCPAKKAETPSGICEMTNNNIYGIEFTESVEEQIKIAKPVYNTIKYETQEQYTQQIDNIPNQYQEVEYIESTGTQYIDTGVLPNKTTEVEIDFLIPQQSYGDAWPMIFGSRTSNHSSDVFALMMLQNNQDLLRFEIGDGIKYINNIPYSKNQKINIKASYSFFSINGTEYQTNFNTPTDGIYPIYLFTLNNSGIINDFNSNVGNKRIYSVKIKNNNVLVRDMVPCYRKSDGVVGLYDKVEGKFYTNQGTGIFLKGSDVDNTTTKTNINNLTYTTYELVDDVKQCVSKYIQPPYGLRVKNVNSNNDIEPNGSIAYVLISHGEDGDKTCALKKPTKNGQAPVAITTIENEEKITEQNKFEAQNCFNAVKQDTYNLVSRSDFLTSTNKEYMFYKGAKNADFDDIVEYSTLAELIKGGAGVNY